jgi:hypothetical protein
MNLSPLFPLGRTWWLLAVASALSAAGAEPPTAPPRRAPAAGLLYYAKADYAFADNRAVIANPYVSGALFQVIWSEVEKQEGRCDWRELDRWIQPWLDAGKCVAIRIMWITSGAWPRPYYKTPTPRWVWEKGAKFAYLAATGTEIPLIWDPVYQQCAWRFLEQFAARYGDNPQLLFVDITPGAETNPYRFGLNNPANLAFKDTYAQTKASDGRSYSEDLWLETVKAWIDASARRLPRTPLLVTLNVGGLRGGDRLTTIGGYCAERGIYVGQNGLNGRSYNEDSGRKSAFLDWSRQTRLFFEMVAKTGGRTGTLMEVMQAAGRIRCNYLNVYPEDVQRGTRGEANFDPVYEEALRFGHETLLRMHASR